MKTTQEITHEVQQLGQWIPALREQVGQVVIGQKYLVDRLLLGLLANGHILLEGVPGLAKNPDRSRRWRPPSDWLPTPPIHA
jgi:MoxR-like ATPase